ncbi:MAG TPA: ABC transporter permease [Clostridiaceae bacterium]|nr:ABC transporter permease [Clostridiaceae bacterium]
MSFRRMSAVFYKEVKDVIRNKMIIFIFFMFPVLSYIFQQVMSAEEIGSVVPTLMTMHIILVPILCMTSIISEEKEKGTLSALMMSNVKPLEYLFGIGLCILLVASISTSLFLAVFSLSRSDCYKYVIFSLAGMVISIIIGSILGLLAKNQMSAGPLAAPVSMILGMLPMFANINPAIRDFSQYLYTQSVFDVYCSIQSPIESRQLVVLGTNLFICIVVFVFVYWKRTLSHD